MAEQRKYTDEEVQAILSRALEKQGIDASKTSHDELRRAAEEVGIAPEDFEAAASEIGESGERRRMSSEYRAWIRRRKRGWARHFAIYLAVCAFLIAIDLFTAQYGAIHWSFFPIAAWGLAVVLHFLVVLFSKDEEEWTERQLRRKEWHRRWRAGKKTFERGSVAFEQIVATGVDALVKALNDPQVQPRARVHVEPTKSPARRVEGTGPLEDDNAPDSEKRARK